MKKLLFALALLTIVLSVQAQTTYYQCYQAWGYDREAEELFPSENTNFLISLNGQTFTFKNEQQSVYFCTSTEKKYSKSDSRGKFEVLGMNATDEEGKPCIFEMRVYQEVNITVFAAVYRNLMIFWETERLD